ASQNRCYVNSEMGQARVLAALSTLSSGARSSRFRRASLVMAGIRRVAVTLADVRMPGRARVCGRRAGRVLRHQTVLAAVIAARAAAERAQLIGHQQERALGLDVRVTQPLVAVVDAPREDAFVLVVEDHQVRRPGESID